MDRTADSLRDRRHDAVRAWTAFVDSCDDELAGVRPEILSSWRRSADAIGLDVTEAPLADDEFSILLNDGRVDEADGGN